LARIKFYEFRNLKEYFTNLSSILEFITSEKYLGKISVDLTAEEHQFPALDPDTKLRIALNVLQKLGDDIRKGTPKFIGTSQFNHIPIKEVVAQEIQMKKEFNLQNDQGTGMRETLVPDRYADLSKEDWYIYDENYGTSEEKALVKFIQGQIPDLEKHYQEIYLLRNQKLFQIFDFDEGRPFEPDFVLFLTDKQTGKQLNYQLFIEPKGEGFIANDQWKEDFLKQIEEKAKINLNLPKHDFRIIGLPFYNTGNSQVFRKAFSKILMNDL
jgi:type III restriction enzyme